MYEAGQWANCHILIPTSLIPGYNLHISINSKEIFIIIGDPNKECILTKKEDSPDVQNVDSSVTELVSKTDPVRLALPCLQFSTLQRRGGLTGPAGKTAAVKQHLATSLPAEWHRRWLAALSPVTDITALHKTVSSKTSEHFVLGKPCKRQGQVLGQDRRASHQSTTGQDRI